MPYPLVHTSFYAPVELFRDTSLDTGSLNNSLWLFFVADAAPPFQQISYEFVNTVVASREAQDGARDLEVARVDPLDSSALTSIDWRPLFTKAEAESYVDSDNASAEFGGFADHWHIFAHGYHWIAVSLVVENTGLGVMLIQFWLPYGEDPVVIHKEVVFKPTSSDDYIFNPGDPGADPSPVNPTNDLFLVETPTGVAIGVRHAPDSFAAPPNQPADGEGHTMILVTLNPEQEEAPPNLRDLSTPSHGKGVDFVPTWKPWRVDDVRQLRGALLDGVDIAHENGASARMVIDSVFSDGFGFRVVAPDSLSIQNESSINLLLVDSDWNSVLEKEVLLAADSGTNLSMAMEAYVPAPGIWLDLPPAPRPLLEGPPGRVVGSRRGGVLARDVLIATRRR